MMMGRYTSSSRGRISTIISACRLYPMRALVGSLVVGIMAYILRDYWLGAPILAFAWLAQHIFGFVAYLAILSKTPAGQSSKVEPPAWTWQDFTSWYQPSISHRWNIIWSDMIIKQQMGALLGLLGVALVVSWLSAWKQRLIAPDLAKADTHGSAHYATLAEVSAYRRSMSWPSISKMILFLLVPLPHVPATGVETKRQALQTWAEQREATRPKLSYLPLGIYHGQSLQLSERQQEEHVLLIAPTGTGKTSRIMLRGLLNEQGGRSLYIPDPKSELWGASSGYFASLGLPIWRFAPAQPERSHGYNPLAYVKDRRGARRLAECFLQNTGGINERDSFWNNCAVSLIVGAISHLQSIDPDAPFYRLVEWFTSMTIDELAEQLNGSPSRDARDCARVIITAMKDNPKIAGGVSTDLASRWDYLRTNEIARVTAQNTINFEAMATSPHVLYSSIPSRDKDSFRFLSACLVMQMLDTFTRIADEDQNRGKLPTPVCCYMDEFTNQGVIPNIGTHISTLRSARVAMIIAAQSYAQIRQVYGNDLLATIQENCSTHITLPGAGQEVCDYLSERIGETTRTGASASAGYTTERSGNESVSQSETRRRLILADEIRTMKNGRMLIVPSRLAPIVTEIAPYYEIRDEKKRTEIEPPYIAGVAELAEPDSVITAAATDEEEAGMLPDNDI